MKKIIFLILLAGYCYGDVKFLSFPYPYNLLKGTNVVQFLDPNAGRDCSTNRTGASLDSLCGTFNGTAYLVFSNAFSTTNLTWKGTATPSVVTSTNVTINNPGFENGTNGIVPTSWTRTGTSIGQRSTTLAQSGSASIVFTNTPNTDDIRQEMRIASNVTYQLSFWANVTRTSGQMVIDTNDRYDATAQTVIAASTAGWQQYAVSFTAAHTNVVVRMFGESFVGTAYFDNFQLSYPTNIIVVTAGTLWDLSAGNSFYPMQDNGDTVHDITSTNHGTITSGSLPLIWTNRQSTSYIFNTNGGTKVLSFVSGSTSVSGLTTPAGLNVGVDAWVRTKTLPATIYSSPTNMSLIINANKSVTLQLLTKSMTTVTNVWTNDVFNHVAASFNGVTGNIWINGVDQSLSATITAPYPYVNSIPAEIGYYAWQGDLARLRTWSYSINGSSLYAGGILDETTLFIKDDFKAWLLYGSVLPNRWGNPGSITAGRTVYIPARTICDVTTTATTSNSVSVSGSSFTAEERTSDGVMSLGSSDLELGRDGDLSAFQTVGIGFTSVLIPPGATVTNAYMRFFANNNGAGTNVTVRIKAESTNNAVIYTTAISNITTRVYTTNSCYWVLTTNIPDNTYFITPQLKDVIQEVVALPGWTNGGALAFRVDTETNNPNFRNVDGEVTLIIEYYTMTNLCASGLGILNPKGFIHNGGPENVRQLGGNISEFNGSSSKINTNMKNIGATTNGLNEWHLVFKPVWTNGFDYLFNNYSSSFSMYNSGVGTLFEMGSAYEGVSVTSNDWNYIKLTFNSATGYMECKNMLTGETDSGTRPAYIGYNLNDTGNNLFVGSTFDGGGSFFEGSMAYFAFYADGVKKIEYILGNVSGTNAPNTGTSITNGQVTAVSVSNDTSCTFAGSKQIGSNPFWSSNGIIFDSKTFDMFRTNSNPNVIVRTNENGFITKLITTR